MLKDGETVEEYMKRAAAELDREENIWCPYCDTKQEEDTKSQHVTYWGETHKEKDRECCCEECGKKFIVEENVKRTFESKKLEDDDDDEN